MSARKRLAGYLLVGAGACLVLLAPLVALVYFSRQTPPTTPPAASLRETVKLSVPAGRTYTPEVADTPAEQERGLSNRDSLPKDQGMVFVYDANGRRCFWMKETRIPLDMVWLDSDKRVTHIERDVSPETYPKPFCHDGTYVIELNAGEAAGGNLQTGQRLSF